MKVTFDIDCTPEEARRFLGFPDLSPVHDAYVEKMRSAVTEGFTGEMMGEMMKSWAPMNEAGLGLWKQMLEQMAGSSGKK
jgi:hypothetical protein